MYSTVYEQGCRMMFGHSKTNKNKCRVHCRHHYSTAGRTPLNQVPGTSFFGSEVRYCIVWTTAGLLLQTLFTGLYPFPRPKALGTWVNAAAPAGSLARLYTKFYVLT
jgi:hypothetical protein